MRLLPRFWFKDLGKLLLRLHTLKAFESRKGLEKAREIGA